MSTSQCHSSGHNHLLITSTLSHRQMDRWQTLVTQSDPQQLLDIQVCSCPRRPRPSSSNKLTTHFDYREIKSDEDIEGEETEEPANGEAVKAESDDVDELAPSTSAGPSTVTERRPSNTPSVTSPVAPSAEASPNPRTVDPKLRNITGGLELLPNRKEGGLIKKTISVAGLHMISCECIYSSSLKRMFPCISDRTLTVKHPQLQTTHLRTYWPTG